LEQQRDPISREVFLVCADNCSSIPGAEKSSRLSPHINKLNNINILPSIVEVNAELSPKSQIGVPTDSSNLSRLPNKEKG
jgi:hypothetical protein